MNQELFDEGYAAGIKNEAPTEMSGMSEQYRMWWLLGWTAGKEMARFISEAKHESV